MKYQIFFVMLIVPFVYAGETKDLKMVFDSHGTPTRIVLLNYKVGVYNTFDASLRFFVDYETARKRIYFTRDLKVAIESNIDVWPEMTDNKVATGDNEKVFI